MRLLHQTTTGRNASAFQDGCSLCVCYIKPQLPAELHLRPRVVPYAFATSNHNRIWWGMRSARVVPYAFATSNHNHKSRMASCKELFLMRLLHQTTTIPDCPGELSCCSLCVCYIKPQPARARQSERRCCSLCVCYIKPQLLRGVVSYDKSCSLCVCYIKPQPSDVDTFSLKGCSLCVCYIKPQLKYGNVNKFLVVPYAFATSNHNRK